MKQLFKVVALAALLLISVPTIGLAQSDMMQAGETTKATQAELQLQNAWAEYVSSWNELSASFEIVDANWQELSIYWAEISTSWQEINGTWDVVANDWQELDQARVLLNAGLGITLSDTEPRLTRDSYVRSSFQTVARTVTAPAPTLQTAGSWAELDAAWDGLNAAWSSTDAAFAELNGAWAELGAAYDEVTVAWTFIDPAFQQINDAFVSVDRTWAEYK